ncbi:D-isomer specific 2-hydroxyacid dehydrogenase [Xylaria sp. CBS 124048]|nr:D-isomer specific 2-hydroxyacid dehydrogenase [Xylaria sp. CBS 124048]
MLISHRSWPRLVQTSFRNRNRSKTNTTAIMKLLYPSLFKMDVASLEGFGVSLHAYDNKAIIPDDLVDAEILVTWANTASNLQDAAKRMKNLRWIQSLAAGPNDVLSAGFPSSVIVTTGSGLHDHTVAEHTLGLLLNAARRFDEMRDYQVQRKWAGHLGGPQPDRPKDRFTTLRDANVLIWGYGNIAKKLTPYLTALGATVRGVARTAGVRNGIEVFSDDKLPELLPRTDALVMILPGSESTQNALGAARLKLLPRHAWVVNVGRGTSVDEDALADALEKGEIGGAALDVFAKEPLPAESRLYTAPNCIVSPHAAGGRPQGCEELIAYNLRRFLAGQELRNVV